MHENCMKKKTGIILSALIILSMALSVFSGCKAGNNSLQGILDKGVHYYIVSDGDLSKEDKEQMLKCLSERAKVYDSNATATLGEDEEGTYISVSFSEDKPEYYYDYLLEKHNLSFVKDYGQQTETILMDQIKLDYVQINQDPETQSKYIKMQMTEEFGKQFAEITQNNIGKSVAVLVDDVMIINPTISAPITDGKVMIMGIEENWENIYEQLLEASQKYEVTRLK